MQAVEFSAIQWVATSSTAYLATGSSLSGFSFHSTQTLAQLTAANSPFYPGTPVGTSFAYHQSPFSDSGHEFVVNPVPEPSAAALAAMRTGLLIGAGARRRWWSKTR